MTTLEDSIRAAVRDEMRAVMRELTHLVRPHSEPAVLLTIAQAAAHACVGATKVRQWIRDGKLRRYGDSPRTVRISRAELERLLAPTVCNAPSEADLDAQVDQIMGAR